MQEPEHSEQSEQPTLFDQQKPSHPKQAEQPTLFDQKEAWQDEWDSMPEFIQEDLMAFRDIVIHFRDEIDIFDFA